MSFFRKLFSIFNFGTSTGFMSRQRINPIIDPPGENLGAEGNPAGFIPSRLFATDPFCEANRIVANPATGLPMAGGIDIGGNPYGPI